ncbi:MAG: hypothetical protein JKY33_03095 [Bacteroidia bacterium]|nr:hypothetical protein [Bacteroidia bacterium]
MKPSSILLASTLYWLLSFTAQAQTTANDFLVKIYDTETILLYGNKYEINGKQHKVGFDGSKLLKAVNESPDAHSEMQLSIKYFKRGTVYSLVALAFGVAGIATMETVDPAIYYSLLGAEVILFGLSISQEHKSYKHKIKAVWLYNRDLL